ncbi:MAG: hypothetical protein WCK15_07750 [Pirellula sp.]
MLASLQNQILPSNFAHLTPSRPRKRSKKASARFYAPWAKAIHGPLAVLIWLLAVLVWRFLFGGVWRCVAVCGGFNSAKPPCHSELHSIQLPKSKIQSPKSNMVNIGRKSFRQREMLARIENHE